VVQLECPHVVLEDFLRRETLDLRFPAGPRQTVSNEDSGRAERRFDKRLLFCCVTMVTPAATNADRPLERSERWVLTA
jgi:hypothetical protein